jgi:hypothetical protein
MTEEEEEEEVTWAPCYVEPHTTLACLHVVQTCLISQVWGHNGRPNSVDLKLVGRDSMTTKMGGGSILLQISVGCSSTGLAACQMLDQGELCSCCVCFSQSFCAQLLQ